jgi:hypothetical protein
VRGSSRPRYGIESEAPPSRAGSYSQSRPTAPATTPRRPPATATGSAKSSSSGSAGASTAFWSQDWFTDREREVGKAVAAYESAVAASDDPDAAILASAIPAPPPASVFPRGKERGPRPNVYAWNQIDDFTDRDLQAMVRWIESDTLLRSREDLIAEVMAELGFERRGKKIVSRISAAIDAVRAQPSV